LDSPGSGNCDYGNSGGCTALAFSGFGFNTVVPPIWGLSGGGCTATRCPRRYGGGGSTATRRCYSLDSRKDSEELAGVLPRQWLREIFREYVSTHGFGVTIPQAKEATLVTIV
jgi:hypothetical protein